jgi:dCMP deaminase
MQIMTETNRTVSDSPSKWEIRFLRLAREVSTWSRDPSTQTGAVFVSPDKKDVILGFNGFASNMNDDPELYYDRKVKYSRIIHCEMNALIIAKRSIQGYTLYTWPFLSCDRCAVHMAQAGIANVVAPLPTANQLERWGAAFEKTRAYFTEAKIYIHEYDLSKHPMFPATILE